MNESVHDRSQADGKSQLFPYRRQMFVITFLLIFVLLLAQLLIILKPFFAPIFWAIILAAATNPVFERLRQFLGGRANIAAGLMTATILIAAVIPAILGVVLAVQQGIEAYAQVSAWLKAGHLVDLGHVLAKLPGIGPMAQELVTQTLMSHRNTLESSVLEGGKAVSTFLLSQSVDLATNAVMFVTDFLVMLFTLFFVFREGEYAYSSLFRAVPLELDHKTKMFERLNRTLIAVVRGTLLTALAQGTVAGLTYFLLGVPFATFLGLASGIASFLPLGGTALVWVPVALYLFFSGSILKALILTGVGILLVGLMDNFLQPLLIGTQARLPVLPLFFASLGGLATFGLLGLFLGPILLAVVMETFTIYQEDYQGSGTHLILSSDMPSSTTDETASTAGR